MEFCNGTDDGRHFSSCAITPFFLALESLEVNRPLALSIFPYSSLYSPHLPSQHPFHCPPRSKLLRLCRAKKKDCYPYPLAYILNRSIIMFLYLLESLSLALNCCPFYRYHHPSSVSESSCHPFHPIINFFLFLVTVLPCPSSDFNSKQFFFSFHHLIHRLDAALLPSTRTA